MSAFAPVGKERMRILYVGYGFHPRVSGGAALIQLEIVRSSRELGYQPVIFQAGLYDFRRDVRLERRTFDDGTLLFNLMNSPNRPGVRNPSSEVYNEVILKASREVLQTVKPDIVHIHELTFHCAALIDECRGSNIPVVKTFHNYWDVCPQRDLLYNGEVICTDYLEGQRCVDCSLVWTHRPQVAAFWNLLSGSLFFGVVQRLWHGWQRFELGVLGRYRTSRPVDVVFDASARQHLSQEYAHRREGFVQRLNRLNCVHVYSHRSGSILRHYGVQQDKIKFLPVSTKAIDRISPRALHDGHVPIRFGYRGGLAPHKGVYVLIEAFKHLDQSLAKLFIYGVGNLDYVSYLRRLAAGANVEFRGSYQPDDISGINSTIDVGVIPSVWEELFGLVGVEYIQSRVPVVASEIGGITEYVVHGVNGILVRPGDNIALGQAMQSFIDRPGLVREMQMNMPRWISVQDMTRNLDSMYRSVLGKV